MVRFLRLGGRAKRSEAGDSEGYVSPSPPQRSSLLRRYRGLVALGLLAGVVFLVLWVLNPTVPEQVESEDSPYYHHHPGSVSSYVLANVRTRDQEAGGGGSPVLLRGGVVSAEMAGLRSYGWSLTPQDAFFRPRRVDRLSWYREQSLQLQQAVYAVYAPVYIMAETPRQYRTSILARRVYDLTVLNQDGYAGGYAHWWRLAPSRFVCDEDLNLRLHQGLEAGCPSAAEVMALSRVWRDLGRLNTSMMAYAQVMLAVPDLSQYNYYRDETLAELVPRLSMRMRDFDNSRQVLANLYHRYGISVHVQSPQSLAEITAALVDL